MKIMAIDYGDSRTGVALSDVTCTIVGECFVLKESGMKKTADRIAQLSTQHSASKIVVGYPRNMNGTLGPRAELSAKLRDLLSGRTGIAVELWDERLSTAHAHRILGDLGQNSRKRKNTIDAVAASLILESYLAANPNK